MFFIGAIVRLVLGGLIGGGASAAGRDIYERVKDKREVRQRGPDARRHQERDSPERLADQVEMLEADVRRLKKQVAHLERQLGERDEGAT